MQRSNALLVFSTVIGLAGLAAMGGLAATGCNGGSSSTGGEAAGTQAQQATAQPATQTPAAQPAAQRPAEQPAAQPPAAAAGTPAAPGAAAAAELAPIETDPRKADLALLCRTLVACWQEDQASGGCHGEVLHTRLRGLAIKLSENRDLREHLIAGNGQGPAVDELGKQLQQHGVACQLVRPAAPAGSAPADGTKPADGATPAEGAKPTQEPNPPPAP